MLELKLPLNNETLSLQTVEQNIFLNEKICAKVEDTVSFRWDNLKKEGIDCSFPMPVLFVWEEKFEESIDDAYYYLLISETKNMQNTWTYITKETSFKVYNFKTGTKYFWCVQKNGKRSEVRSFNTFLTLPRCIKIDNISNVRDMGGYNVEEGNIRQGLVYRGGEFEIHMHLGQTGVEELKRLSIRTEIDMRGEAKYALDFTTSEAIGIKREYVPCLPYADVFKKEQRSAVKKFFNVFANPNNYPIYYHCWGGADRTGTYAFILGAFMGMSLEDLCYEYEFTSLSIWGIRSRNSKEFRQFLELFMELHGDTLREKSITFLKDFGKLTNKQLDTIYNILLERE